MSERAGDDVKEPCTILGLTCSMPNCERPCENYEAGLHPAELLTREGAVYHSMAAVVDAEPPNGWEEARLLIRTLAQRGWVIVRG